MKFGEWCDMWLSIITPIRSPQTISSYRGALRHVAGLLDREIAEVDAPAWQRAVNQVASQLPRQAQIAHAALRAAWRFGQKQGVIPSHHSPWAYVAAPDHHAKPILYLTPAEMSSYARAVRSTPAALPLLLMMLCGLRRGEALGLKWSQIDYRSMVLYIDCQIVNGKESRPKSKASVRKVPFCAEIAEIIERYGDKTSRLCYNGGVRQVYSSHKRALRNADIPAEITLHGLRHSCATAALAAGVPVTAVQHLLGHAHFSTTADIYNHALIDPQRQAVEQLAKMAV